MGGHRLSKYPILYKGDATDFFTLGLGPIQMLKATVTQERNGIFIFEGEILTDSPLFPLVLENYIIKADADHLLKDQRFRIKRIVPNHNGKAEIYAEHVSYLSRELTIKPEVSITGSAQTALSQWKASIVEPNPFVVDSDIPTSNKTKWRIDKVENPRMALGGVEGSILDVWGGEYRFDNYHISLLQKRGTTAKTVLAYGRNITDFEQERNIANTYTSIMPYAIYNDANENEVLVHIDGYVVDSEHINKYPNRVVQAVNFSSEFEHDEVPTKARILALANQYIKANEIGVPSTSIKVSFVDLSKSPDYAEYAFLEQVNLCDDVRVYYPKLGVNTVAKVIRTVWNVLTESYDEIEIGQKRMSLVGQMQQQQQAIKEIDTQTNYAMTSADGKNTIFYGLYGENGLGEPKAIKVGDTWYKPNGTGTDMLVWTGTIWKVLLDAETFNEINEKIDQAEKDIAQNIIDIDKSLSKAEQAELDAGFATDLAKDASALANQTAASLVNVKAAADQAKADASTSLTNAQNALNKAIKSSVIHYALSANGTTPPATGWQTSNPNPTADQYVWTRTTITLNDNSTIVSYSVGKIGSKGDKGDIGLKGDTGLPGVNAPKIISVKEQYYLSTSNASPTGGSWVDTVPTWSSGKYYWLRVSTTFDNATTTLSTPVLDAALNQSLVKTLEVQTATQNLSATVTQHATLIESKANSTTVDTIAGRVTTAEGSISTIAGKVELKANSTDVNTLTGRVTTAEGRITTNAQQIELRATKTDVNTLTGRVSTAEGNITTQAGLIALKANSSVVDTLTGRVTATEASIKITDGKVTTLTSKTDGNTTQIGLLESSYSGLNSTVTQVKNNLDNMEIGGRNLLLDSFTFNRLNSNDSALMPIQKGTDSTGNWVSGYRTSDPTLFSISIYFPVYTDHTAFSPEASKLSPTADKVTWSTEVMSTHSVKVGITGGQTVTLTPNVWQRISGTFNAQTRPPILTSNNTGVPSTAKLYHRDWKLEKGNVATAHSPAPEDYTTVTAFSTLEQNLNGFKTTVQNTYADKTTVTQLSTQWTTTTNLVNGHTTQIASLGSDINLRATKTEVAESILADKTIKDTRTTNQLPPWYYTNYPKQKAYEFKTCATIGLPTSAGTYASVVTEVPWTDASGGTIEQTATATDGVYQRRGTTTWSAWAKVADSSNIVSQINISPESILIASNKIQIKGDTYIDNGVIKTAHIADLAVSGAKIANASIASAKIISLDAAKITANTLSAITTNTGALNVSGNLTMMTDNTLITGHYEYSDAYNAYEPRTFVGNFYLGRRYIEFRGDTWEYKNGNVKNSFLGFNETFYGQDYLKLRTYDNSVSRNLLSRIDMYNGRLEMGKSFSETNLYLNNEGVIYCKQIIGERMETNRIDFRGLATFVINEKKEHNLPTLRMTAAEEAIFSIESPSPQKANLYLGGDTSPRIWSGAFYSRTYPSAANVVVTDQGTIGRAVSAAKYKTNISTLYSTIKNAKQVLKIQPKTWWDKRALEETGKIREGYGYIADEFHHLGLTEVVQYDSLGEIEGLAYDRISMYHNVILQDHEQQLKKLDSLNTNVIKLVANSSTYGTRLNNLESEVFRLKKRIEELEKIA